MSEFTDSEGRLLTGRNRRYATHLDGHTSREIRKGERIEARGLEKCLRCELNFVGPNETICEDCEDKVPSECRECAKEDDCEFRFDLEKCEEERRRNAPRFPPFSVTIKLLDFGSLKALAEIKFGEMTIRGFKIIETEKGGRWVASPSREVRIDGKQAYYEIVKFSGKEAIQQFRDLIMAEYKEALK